MVLGLGREEVGHPRTYPSAFLLGSSFESREGSSSGLSGAKSLGHRRLLGLAGSLGLAASGTHRTFLGVSVTEGYSVSLGLETVQ